MIKILLLVCAFLIMPFAMADESVVVTATIKKPAFFYMTHPPAMVNQERSYNVTGEDHAVINSERPNNDGWEGFNRAEVPFEIGWRI